MTPSRFFVTIFCSALLAASCAAPGWRTVDKMFPATHIERRAMDAAASEIHDHSKGSVIILVKYVLKEPFGDALRLAQAQGKAVKKYLRTRGVTAPIEIVTGAAPVNENEIWISYQVPGNKTAPVPVTPPPAKPETKPETEKPAKPDPAPEIISL